MDDAKIRLSAEEMELVKDTRLILTKNRIIQRTVDLLSAIQTRLQPLTETNRNFPHEIITSSPRISKGENYQGLPWVVLDYPRYFDKENVFAIRTMFWWGQFFSCTLHLSGLYRQRFEKSIAGSFAALQKEKFSACINEEQWVHHFGSDNYTPLRSMSFSEFEELCKRPFIKIAKQLPVANWNTMEDEIVVIFRRLIAVLKD